MCLSRSVRTLFLLSALGLSGCRISANFHEIDPGKYYRSAQLTRTELQQAIDRVGIRTIINLRGEAPGSKWYQDEVAVAEKNGVELVNIEMDPAHIPHREQLTRILDAFQNSKRPILLHCKAGADRTGLASALYELEYMGKSKREALKMLALKYHHVQQIYPAMRYFVHAYQGSAWAYSTYDPCKQSYKYYDQKKFCAPEAAVTETRLDVLDDRRDDLE